MKKLRMKGPGSAAEVIKATVTLHNLALKHQPEILECNDVAEELDEPDLHPPRILLRNAAARELGNRRREEIYNMF